MSDFVIQQIVAWAPYVLYLGISVWLTFKLIAVQRQMVDAQRGILQKMTDIERKLVAPSEKPSS
ncbi:hypothetical protein [Aminobacter aminovorans]|jgi:hypothetical protein|uniref:hypothetical protein n=1 Tax=Aminobacter aminovorans TaxID=83263 RepID=UPI0028589C86|nr:hypothetical protein [Aminobacter aminovorans]MDR7221865.1 hypothetical protein [Aminobacter aminovorans]